MSEVRLVVRESERDWSGTIHGSCADHAIAALSADPVTLAELEAATARFVNSFGNGRFFINLSSGLRDEPYDAGLVVIDLVARLVMVDSSYSSPGPTGSVRYHNGDRCTDTQLYYHLADDWLFLSDRHQWRGMAEERRRESGERSPLDAREIFYGRPMLEFIARETFAKFARRDEIAATVRAQGQDEFAGLFYDTLKEIHAAWLLTPRGDLGGASPRDVAFERREHLSWDLQDRCQQWSSLGECPPGLDESSFAFRHGGFGIHELVKYYDLVRELLWSCWERLDELNRTPRSSDQMRTLTVGDFLATELSRLEQVRDSWLDTPDPECHGRTPRSIIHRERARLPEGVCGHEAMIDPDCPCCQMMADMPGPVFWHLDGSEMDDDFAFDLFHHTREEWDQKQREWEEFDRRFNAEWNERERLGVTDSTARDEDGNSVWSSSFRVGDSADVPLGIRVFGIGCRLAEVIVNLRGDAGPESNPSREGRQFIDRLNRDFGNLREILQNSEPSLAEALIDPVLDRFAETLSTVATARPELGPHCESLTDELNQLLEPPSQEPSEEFPDDDVPF